MVCHVAPADSSAFPVVVRAALELLVKTSENPSLLFDFCCHFRVFATYIAICVRLYSVTRMLITPCVTWSHWHQWLYRCHPANNRFCSDFILAFKLVISARWSWCGCVLKAFLLLFRSRMLRRGWILQVIWDIKVSLLLSLRDTPRVQPGYHLLPLIPPFVPIQILLPFPAPSSDHPRGKERRPSLCKYAWMEVSLASRSPELPDLWPGDLCGSWDHIRSSTAAGGWSRRAVHDHGAR